MRHQVRFAFAGMGALLFAISTFAAEKSTATQLIELAKSHSPALKEAIANTLDVKELKDGIAWIGHGPDFFFAVETSAKPTLVIDGNPGPQMQSLSGTNLWYGAAHIEPVGSLHSFSYLVNSAKFGGRLDLPAFTPLSYQQPGIPSGTLSPKLLHTSKIYDGMKSEYWNYVLAQYDPKTPAALLVVQDGEDYIDREGKNKTLNV